MGRIVGGAGGTDADEWTSVSRLLECTTDSCHEVQGGHDEFGDDWEDASCADKTIRSEEDVLAEKPMQPEQAANLISESEEEYLSNEDDDSKNATQYAAEGVRAKNDAAVAELLTGERDLIANDAANIAMINANANVLACDNVKNWFGELELEKPNLLAASIVLTILLFSTIVTGQVLTLEHTAKLPPHDPAKHLPSSPAEADAEQADLAKSDPAVFEYDYLDEWTKFYPPLDPNGGYGRFNIDLGQDTTRFDPWVYSPDEENDYNEDPWEDLDETEMESAMRLGWNVENWGSRTAKTETMWTHLSDRDQEDAELLGYDEFSWDDEDEFSEPAAEENSCGDDPWVWWESGLTGKNCSGQDDHMVSDASAQLRAFKMSELRSKARDVGLLEDAIDDAGDQADPKKAMIRLIVDFEATQLADLKSLKISELRKRAKDAGYDEDAIDLAGDDEANPKVALSRLLRDGEPSSKATGGEQAESEVVPVLEWC